jgi:uncharacterized protein (TIGR02147 family)
VLLSIFNTLLKILLCRPFINSITGYVTKNIFYQDQLKKELAQRCQKNVRYSVRAFARALDVDVGALSRILSGKQIPSYKLAQKVAAHLDLTPTEHEFFISSVAEKHQSRDLQRLSPILRSYKKSSAPAALDIDHYRVIADWYHFAILELTFVSDFESNPRWISKQLGISITETKLAIERLTRCGLLMERNGRYIKTQEQLSSSNKHLTTPALRRNQKQFLEKAVHSLENDPIEDRNMSSMTMAIDPEKIPTAKLMIREFNQALCQFLESGKRKRVYNMEIAFYPLQINSKKRKKN